MKLLPMLASFIASYIGWAVGRPFGIFAGALFSIIAGALGFYYARKFQKEIMG